MMKRAGNQKKPNKVKFLFANNLDENEPDKELIETQK
jgi:hypothetical protein